MYSVDYRDCGTPAPKLAAEITLQIDGTTVTVPAGTSIMRAAAQAGTAVPKLCATDTLKAFGSCRLCLVEIEGRRGYPASCTTEVAAGYKKRFEKNRDRLFTFLDHDGVPWNNNNAEHAIKAFARLRNAIGAKSTPKGIKEYLVLLSISETCRYKGVGFLHFLRSGEMDIDAFAARPAGRTGH